ncbi:MAG: hypothetical protein ACLTBV_18815 [Enterocloster bolteae]
MMSGLEKGWTDKDSKWMKRLGNPAALQNAEQCCGKYPVFFAGKGVDLWRGGWGCGDRAFITGMAKILCYPVIDSREMCFLGCNLFGLYGYTLGEYMVEWPYGF